MDVVSITWIPAMVIGRNGVWRWQGTCLPVEDVVIEAVATRDEMVDTLFRYTLRDSRGRYASHSVNCR